MLTYYFKQIAKMNAERATYLTDSTWDTMWREWCDNRVARYHRLVRERF